MSITLKIKIDDFIIAATGCEMLGPQRRTRPHD
jgi:hypothetical protein